MFVTSERERSGILVAVITGGRPQLRKRPTHRLLDALTEAGVADVVWVLSDVDAQGYEADSREFSVYERSWALEYAAQHWMRPEPVTPDSFLGAFPGREWACREAERRGCWGVLQLDDNITQLSYLRGGAAGIQVAREAGGLGMYVDLIAATTLATNSRMTGTEMISTAKNRYVSARVGFPYSLFLEQVGEGREPWLGPFEDDITHALQYGNRADGTTAVLLPLLKYQKVGTMGAKDGSGMRSKYGSDRSLHLQRLFPESARIGVHATHSNGKGKARIFHKMNKGSIRNPLVIKDIQRFEQVRERITQLGNDYDAVFRDHNRAKVIRRVKRG